MTTVRDAHPYVQVGEHRRPSWDLVGTKFRNPGPEDDEDIDALPVAEQAAILLSVIACDAAVVREGPARFVDLVSDEAGSLATEAFMSSGKDKPDGGWCVAWAEAEARIRCGEVTP